MLQAITLMDCTLFLNYPHLKSTDGTTMACNLSVLPQNSFHNTVCTFKSLFLLPEVLIGGGGGGGQAVLLYLQSLSLSHISDSYWELAMINWLSISISGTYITFRKCFFQGNQLNVQYCFKMIRLDNHGNMAWFLVGAKRFFSPPKHSHWLWGPSSLPFPGYWGKVFVVWNWPFASI
jgi:hypothetical protein